MPKRHDALQKVRKSADVWFKKKAKKGRKMIALEGENMAV